MAAGCGPNQQQDPFASKFKPVVFTSITQHATEANYTHIIICQLKIVLPPPNSHANAPQVTAELASLRLAAMLGLFFASPGKLGCGDAGRCWNPPLPSSVRHGCLSPSAPKVKHCTAGLAPPDPVLQRSEIWGTSVSNLSAVVFQPAMQGYHYATGAVRSAVWRGLRLYQLYLLFHAALDDTLDPTHSASCFLNEYQMNCLIKGK